MTTPPRLLSLLAAAVAASLSAAPALAGREPTDEERPRIEAALRALGFERWDDIELEGDVWKVDDARAPDGKEYELKLRAQTLEVIERKED